MTENTDDSAYEVEFLNCVIDKADDYRVVEADSHFAEFAGIHPSKIKQGKVFLTDIIEPADRQYVFDRLCKKSSKYVYIDFNITARLRILKTQSSAGLCLLMFQKAVKRRAN